jgi:hypothetical protein
MNGELTGYRLYCRRVLMGSLGAADHLMFIALVSILPSACG